MSYSTQNSLLLNNLLQFYQTNTDYLDKMLSIINGDSQVSLRIVDWFATNYAKKITRYMILQKRIPFVGSRSITTTN